jgi:hypothetical protein
MKSCIILSFFWITVFLLFFPACTRNEWTIKVDPENPHYFNYKGKPIILVTSDHTYFGVTAPDFDYVKFLDKLAANSNNFTRIYPGAYPSNYFNQQRIFPWIRDTSGKYDLDKWDPAYFKRLHGFMQYAQSKGIIVDICLFNGFGSEEKKTYQQRWNWCPLKDSNNIQVGIGTKRDYFCTLEEPALVNYEKTYVRKIVSELNQYDNLIYDISDEPDFFNTIDDSKVNPWISEIIDEVIKTEASLPKKHIFAETHHSSLEDNGKKWGADPRTSWISVEYDKGLNAFGMLYAYNKPCVLIETTTPVFNPIGGFWGFGYGINASRVHSWAYILAGGAGFMEFNDDYDSQAPGGRASTDTILQQRKILKDFMYGFDYTKMYSYTDFTGINKNAIRYDTTGQAWGTAIAETGKQYALYVSHSYAAIYPKGPGYYVAVPGTYSELIVLQDIPKNTYKVEWINPSGGEIIQTLNMFHSGGDLPLQIPGYTIDIVLRMKVISGVKQEE